MKDIIEGTAYVLGNDIDTDQIIPAEHLVYSLSDPEEKKNYGKFALSGVPAENAGLPEGNKPLVPEGDYHSPGFCIDREVTPEKTPAGIFAGEFTTGSSP